MGMGDVKHFMMQIMQKMHHTDQMMRAMAMQQAAQAGAQAQWQPGQIPGPPPGPPPQHAAPGPPMAAAAPFPFPPTAPQPGIQPAPMFGAAAAAAAATSPFEPGPVPKAAPGGGVFADSWDRAFAESLPHVAQAAAESSAAVRAMPATPIPTEQPDPVTPPGRACPTTPVAGMPTPLAPKKEEKQERASEEPTPTMEPVAPISPTQPFNPMTQEDPYLPGPVGVEVTKDTIGGILVAEQSKTKEEPKPTGESPPRKEARAAADHVGAARTGK